VTGEKAFKDRSTTAECLRLLTPERLPPDTVEAFRRDTLDGRPTLVTEVAKPMAALHALAVDALAAGDFDSAAGAVERYADDYRCRHDLLVEYVAIYPLVVAKRYGRAVMDAALRKSFASGLTYAGMWQLAAHLSLGEVAASWLSTCAPTSPARRGRRRGRHR